MIIKLMELFNSTSSPEKILALAREFKAVQRLRNIHPANFCNALVGCSMGDEERSIATARRLYGQLAGYAPEESSFYDRFNAGLAKLMRTLYEQALAAATNEQRAAVGAVLDDLSLKDILAIDGSQVTLPKATYDVLPSTSKDHGGFKVTATLSVAYQALRRIDLTDARTHDRKALKLDRWLNNQLLLLDRGYSDHSLFAEIERRKGF
ncbi:MAG: transposase, partial [Myxococcales bacterium]|nr:transposase [Myxococcales bacterium]